MMRDRYIRASELKSFDFCAHAWHFEQKNTPSTLEPEREDGRREHATHAAEAARNVTTSRLAAVTICIGLIGIVISIGLWAFNR